MWIGQTPRYIPVEQWTWAFSLLLIWSYTFQKTDSDRKGCMPLCFWTVVPVTHPLKQQSSSITEQMEAQRSLNDSRTDVQYRKNKGHDWHFIVHQCVSAKALMLQWAGGLWLWGKKVWVRRKLMTSYNVPSPADAKKNYCPILYC